MIHRSTQVAHAQINIMLLFRSETDYFKKFQKLITEAHGIAGTVRAKPANFNFR